MGRWKGSEQSASSMRRQRFLDAMIYGGKFCEMAAMAKITAAVKYTMHWMNSCGNLEIM
ncbi:MAG: hypothetical protein ACLU4N_19410 [Butyricimonas faecihominis]